MLFMSCFLFFFSSSLLHSSSFKLLFSSEFSSFKSLCLYQFSITNFFIFFLLLFDDSEFFFFEYHHACLFECLGAEDGEHGLDLLVEVEQLRVLVHYLRPLAVLLRRHPRLKQGHRWTVQIKLCRYALLTLRWFIS